VVLSENVENKVLNLATHGATAEATISAKYSGCTEFCELWKEVRQMPNYIGRNIFGTYNPSFDFDAVYTKTVRFSWDQNRGWHAQQSAPASTSYNPPPPSPPAPDGGQVATNTKVPAQQGKAAKEKAITNSTVTHNSYVVQGGLTWMPVTSLETWPNANSFCASFNGLGQTGWRLPTQPELSALYASRATNGLEWTLGNIWSSTPGSIGGHYLVFMGHGDVSSYFDKFIMHVMCVRESPAL
ncbi:MAG: Lcl domain-containing protein, partial [Sulfuricella sp.]